MWLDPKVETHAMADDDDGGEDGDDDGDGDHDGDGDGDGLDVTASKTKTQSKTERPFLSQHCNPSVKPSTKHERLNVKEKLTNFQKMSLFSSQRLA